MERSEDLLVGLVALAVVPWIGWTIVRGLREERLPIGKAYVSRRERHGAFMAVLALYVAAAVMIAWLAFDLLAGRAG